MPFPDPSYARGAQGMAPEACTSYRTHGDDRVKGVGDVLVEEEERQIVLDNRERGNNAHSRATELTNDE